MHAIGGQQHPSRFTSEDECVTKCGKVHGCAAIDFDPSQAACWMHTANTACSQLVRHVGVSYVRIVDCSENPTSSFLETVEDKPSAKVLSDDLKGNPSDAKSCT